MCAYTDTTGHASDYRKQGRGVRESSHACAGSKLMTSPGFVYWPEAEEENVI